jgi:hypothetical protein
VPKSHIRNHLELIDLQNVVYPLPVYYMTISATSQNWPKSGISLYRQQRYSKVANSVEKSALIRMFW